MSPLSREPALGPSTVLPRYLLSRVFIFAPDLEGTNGKDEEKHCTIKTNGLYLDSGSNKLYKKVILDI